MDDVSEATFTGDPVFQEQKIEFDKDVAPEIVKIPDYKVEDTPPMRKESNDNPERKEPVSPPPVISLAKPVSLVK